ncbi:TetR/AcrR family transcriptional regulator [Bermanella sp. WJH001]|uniref:TetR/AcrR family transcriptional regulator n=1 Tax=Bermanella sp. WJH001 TaxID=3048005 RepID=UPI0024BED5C4|nr:TetR/AcrR family transcriptional regulator [Bermanella sp. WJH001]MDJ1538222.1 TetR/AcrR family transcriptional regulator [Bermanella sp. WJH001]
MKDTSRTSNLKASANQPYHHGNLRLALLNASVDIIRSQGVAALSLRKLADVVGVSRTAPYHHFKDKDALLAAVASQGFEELSQLLSSVVNDEQTQLQPKLTQAVMGYLHFAIEHPTQYELMFGQALWKDSEQDGFRRTAKDCFRQYVKLFELFSDQGLINNQEPPLRLAQMTWASLHGLARLASDGIFAKQDDIHDIAQTAVRHLELILQSKPA